MELLQGEDLRARLNREGTLSFEEALKITREVLRALVRAHAAGIVHRDLKPDNVFLCRRDDGSFLVKIVDFGISKLSHAGASERLTYRGTVLGSAHYVSPEQAHGSDNVDQRADIYGVGVLLFEMLAGRPPHVAEGYEAVLVAICTEDAPDVRTFRSDTPEPLARAIARALSREPALRFPNADALLDALSDGSSDRPGTKRRSTGLVVAGVLATLLGFLATAIVVARRAASAGPVDARDPSASSAVAATASERSEPSAPAAPRVEPLGVVPVTSAGTSMDAGAEKERAVAPKAERKRPAPERRPDAGVAGSLELSTREP
jgi:serine/threonine-protein kinase